MEHQPTSIVDILVHEQKMTAKQVKIIEAAIELISENGYAATSTSDIAKRAGVAEGTIFRHYGTKKGLLLSIVDPVIAQFIVPVFAERFVAEVFHTSYIGLQDFLHHFIQNRFAFMQANIPLIKIMVQEFAFHPEIKQAFQTAFKEKVYPEISRTLDYFKEKGEIRGVDTEALCRMIAPTVIGFLFTRFMIQPDKDWDDEAAIAETVQYIMYGITKAEQSKRDS